MIELTPLLQFDRIVIVGVPMSGKTTLCNMIEEKKKVSVLHTDDITMSVPWKQAPKKILDEIRKYSMPYVIEGVQAYRLLRNGFIPEVVVCLLPEYPPLAQHVGLRKTCMKIWQDVLNMNPSFKIIETTLHGKGLYKDNVIVKDSRKSTIRFRII